MTAPLFPTCPVLIVDDDRHILDSTERTLGSVGITNVRCCADSRDVRSLLAGAEFAAVLLDLTMPYVSGQEILQEVTESYPELPVVIVTGANEIETAVKCMRAGAFDYMVKPVERSRLLSGVQRAVELHELRAENALLTQRILSGTLDHPDAFADIVTRNAAMMAIFRYIETVAPSPRPVLITGETGVGKELIAKALHSLSGRTGHFVTVNAAGLDDGMFSDTLFGHMRGAYTGADTPRKGLIEQAAGGTLFLDEIGDLSPASQVKLLRLLQEREYFPLGSDVRKRTDARILVATNRDLDALRDDGHFRRDLFHRLKTHHIHVPPLRERLDDLPLLLDHFLEQASQALDKKKPTPPQELVTLLTAHPFEGNIRELEAMVFEAVSQHESRVLSLDVFKRNLDQALALTALTPGDHSERKPVAPFAAFDRLPSFKEANQWLVEEAMRRANGNQGLAARLLGISRTALNKRLNQIED